MAGFVIGGTSGGGYRGLPGVGANYTPGSNPMAGSLSGGSIGTPGGGAPPGGGFVIGGTGGYRGGDPVPPLSAYGPSNQSIGFGSLYGDDPRAVMGEIVGRENDLGNFKMRDPTGYRDRFGGGAMSQAGETYGYGGAGPVFSGGGGLLGGMSTAGPAGPGAVGMVDPNAAPAMGGAPRQGDPSVGGYSAGGGNGYLSAMADEIGRRSNQALGQAHQGIRSNSVGVGGLGGTRQGVAEGIATGAANDALTGNLANLFGNQYNQDANRSLQRYGIDTNDSTQRLSIGNQFTLGNRGLDNQLYGMNQQYDLGRGGLANQRYGIDRQHELGMGGLENQRYIADQNFYQGQRGQDLQSVALGGNLYSNGMNGEWGPLNNANDIYRPYGSTSGTTNTNGGGNNWQNILAGLGAGAQFGNNMGWWGK